MQEIKKETGLLLIISALLLAYALDFLQLITGFILLFFLPGYALKRALFPKQEIDIWENISLTICLSISLCIVSVFSANYFLRIPITLETIAIEILSLTGVFIIAYLLRRPREVLRNGVSLSSSIKHDTSRKKIISTFTILLILILSFNLVYRIHWDYPYPFHTDEWQHIAHGIQIVENESIELTNPYYIDKPPYKNLEIGFHVFLAEFFLLTGRDPVLFYKFLPAVLACISAFILFVFIYRVTGSFPAGFFSVLFFAGLKSNISILGSWFFVPLTLSFPLLYLVFYSVSIGLKRGSFPLLLSATIALLTLTLVHPSVASFAYMSITLYLTLVILYSILITVLCQTSGRRFIREEPDSVLKSPVQLIAGVLVMFSLPSLSFLYFLTFLWKGSLIGTVKYFVVDFMVFRGSLPVEELYKPFFILDLYGLLGIALAAIGILYALMKNRGLILVSGITVALGILALYQLRGFTVLLYYERTVYCALLCFAPLSGMGLYALTDLLRRIFKDKNKVSCVIALSLLFFVFLNVFSDYYMYKDKTYRMIDEDDYNAIKWLGEDRRGHNIVLARPRISDAIYPISKNYVVAVTPHGRSDAQNLLDTRRFLMSGCDGRREVLEDYDVDYVLVKFRINCDFLEEIYHRGEDYIYEVRVS